MPITKGQVKRLCTIATTNGWDDEARDELVAEYGYDSKKDIRREDYEEICDRLEKPMENEKKHRAGKRDWVDIREDLAQPIPDRLLSTKTLKGNKITYCPWYRVQKILDHYTNGYWDYEVIEKTITPEHFLVTVRIYIESTDGRRYREGTGIEELSTTSYGDYSSNAESMAFRRAAARFGLGVDLYEGGDD